MSGRTADTLRESLEQMILSGEFEDGERLDETRLSARLGVSRTPLRESFQMLAATGLVELIPRRGAFVRQPDVVQMFEMFEVMAELEAMCGRLAARLCSEEDLRRMHDAADDCDRALELGDADIYYRANEVFHNALYQASGNSFLAGEASRLHKRLQPFRRMQLRVRGRLKQSMDEHRDILMAIEAADEDRAAQALRSHIAIQGKKFNDLMASYSKGPAKLAS
ncbi:MAG: GntR family transcriptional regulator [Alphaproteobacteria bacterium]|jgi:DNA-binding GntR family transcriptional regulator|uniref:GntR family transcriptional regulator n=1 Tax=Pacificispira sp. TaxID=2888761 RepID=UPI001B2E3C61|nr:GntR family transcriptional regulator [Alphaproteobacteria bacterium]MBO6861942.1 GntR family transcriptional regulator [Alphaproteobacteria bacterium]MEC9265057.1 GntR family transcriptional regulator [Pseudomonadota bacterium]